MDSYFDPRTMMVYNPLSEYNGKKIYENEFVYPEYPNSITIYYKIISNSFTKSKSTFKKDVRTVDIDKEKFVYYSNNIGEFRELKGSPKRKPKKSGYNSRYWFVKDKFGWYVIRESDHWSYKYADGKLGFQIGTCYFILTGMKLENVLLNEKKVGIARINNFKHIIN